jgi:hypothetical protein
MGRIGVATSLHRASGPTSSMVVRYEKTCRTFKRGNANERGFIYVCVLWDHSPKAASQYRKGHTGQTRVNRLRSRGAFERLEPDEGKLSRPVLRGGDGRKAVSLPDSISAHFRSVSKRKSVTAFDTVCRKFGWKSRKRRPRRSSLSRTLSKNHGEFEKSSVGDLGIGSSIHLSYGSARRYSH